MASQSYRLVPAFLHYMQDTRKPRGGIAVAEFGFVEPFEELETLLPDIGTDLARTAYYPEYMQAIFIAISQGVNVVGTLAWSILDNLEWSQGYTVKFGMQNCNFTTQEGHFKASFLVYMNAFKQGTTAICVLYLNIITRSRMRIQKLKEGC
jgi:hypothetical protein